MRVLVVGAGGTGGYYGGRLFQAGRDVTFLVRPARATQLRERGLEIVSPHGDATIPVPVVTADELRDKFDVVLLGVKGYALPGAMADMAPAVGTGTMIVPVLNGMIHLDRLVERFGADAVVGGVSHIAGTLDAQGRVVQLTPMHSLTYGRRPGAGPADPARLQALHATFSNAGFDARLSESIEQDLWEKWVFLATLGGITCLLRGTIGEIEAVPGGAALARRMRAEAAAVAAASGWPLPAEALARIDTFVTTPGSPLASSMYRDLQAGADVEVESILADLVRRAEGFGQDAPLLAAATAQLRIHRARRR